MTVLDVAKTVAKKVGVGIPDALLANTKREYVELVSLLNECASDIAGVFDWQSLKSIATLTGNGVAEGFNLPTDYDRMLRTASVWSSRYLWAMEQVVSTDDWLGMITRPYTAVSGAWTIYGDQFHILALMGTGETAKFFYISNQLVKPASGANQKTFTQDTDSFRLSEKLLGLAAVVKWKAANGQDYSEDLASYEIELGNLMDKDAGSKPVVRGGGIGTRAGSNVWPRAVGGLPA